MGHPGQCLRARAPNRAIGWASMRYACAMTPINLADPAFEPTDQQLVDLSKRAFANLPDRRRAIDAKVRESIRAARESLRVR